MSASTRSTTDIQIMLSARYDWFEGDLPEGGSHEYYFYFPGKYQERYRALNAEINTEISAIKSKGSDTAKFRGICLNVMKTAMDGMKNPFELRHEYGETKKEFKERKALEALTIYCRFKYILEQLDAGVSVALIAKPFAITKSKEKYKYDDQGSYLKAFNEIFKFYLDDEILNIINNIWPYITDHYCPRHVHEAYFARFRVVPEPSLQKKFLTKLVLPNFTKYVSSYNPWGLLLPDTTSHVRNYEFNLINADTMDCFLDPQSAGYVILKARRDFVKYIDVVRSPFKSLDEEAALVTSLVVKYPHVFAPWQQEWNEECARPSYHYYSRREDFYSFISKRLRLTQENGDFFFNPTKEGWQILGRNGLLRDFILNSDKQLVAPLLLRYPDSIAALCMAVPFESLIGYIRTLPPLLAKERMDLIGGDNFTALLMLGSFRAIPVGRTLAHVFDMHRDIASQMVYESAASGDFARLQGLLSLSMDTTVQKDKHTATVSPFSDKSGGGIIVHQSKIVHQQDTTEYRESINFSLNEFLSYLERKFKFTLEEQRPQLFFIQETELFVDKLIEHKKLKEADRDRFHRSIVDKFHVEGQPSMGLPAKTAADDGMTARLVFLESENKQLKDRLKVVEDTLKIILQSPAIKEVLETMTHQQDNPGQECKLQ